MKICDFLSALKIACDVTSDYALAPHLGVSRTTVLGYRRGTIHPDTHRIIEWCTDILNWNPAATIAALNEERAKTEEERAVWATIRDVFVTDNGPEVQFLNS